MSKACKWSETHHWTSCTIGSTFNRRYLKNQGVLHLQANTLGNSSQTLMGQISYFCFFPWCLFIPWLAFLISFLKLGTRPNKHLTKVLPFTLLNCTFHTKFKAGQLEQPIYLQAAHTGQPASFQAQQLTASRLPTPVTRAQLTRTSSKHLTRYRPPPASSVHLLWVSQRFYNLSVS